MYPIFSGGDENLESVYFSTTAKTRTGKDTPFTSINFFIVTTFSKRYLKEVDLWQMQQWNYSVN